MGILIDFIQYKKQREMELKEDQKLSDDFYIIAYELFIYELSMQILPLMKILEWEMIYLNENGDLSFTLKDNNEE